MASMNRVFLIGNLVRDVEIRYTAKGTAVAEITLAVNNSYTDKTSGTKKDEVCYVDCTLWARMAELASEYVKKGSPLLITGRLKTDSWDDAKTGTKRSKLGVVAEDMQFIGGKQSESKPKDSESSYTKKESNDFDPDDFPSDNVPF